MRMDYTMEIDGDGHYRFRWTRWNPNGHRFIPMKRIALDGCTWWCIYDTARSCWSTYTAHGKYKTRQAAVIAIEISGLNRRNGTHESLA